VKTLVFFYSRTGTTRAAAQEIASACGCPAVEIVDRKDRSGPAGYLSAGKDAMRRRLTDIAPVPRDPSEAEVVVVGTPVWAFTVSPAVRTFLSQHAGRLPQVAFFCTQGGCGGKRALREMTALAGKQPVATLVLNEREMRSGAFRSRVRAFVSQFSHGDR